MGEDDLLAHKECDWWGRGIPGPLTTAWIVATVAAVVLSACSPGAVAQTSSLASPPADLRQIAYDSATAGPVLEEGRAIFVQSLRPRHPIRWEESIMLFPTDQAMLNWAADRVQDAGLDAGQGEKVLRYFLAVRHGYGSSPCQ